MLTRISSEKNLKENRGACFVIAGIIRGMGVHYFEDYNVLKFITENTTDLKKISVCHGCIQLIHALYITLVKILEPYSFKLLKILMKFYGCQNKLLRDFSLDVTKTIMQNLSGFGVRTLMPLLIEGLKETKWRAKIANI